MSLDRREIFQLLLSTQGSVCIHLDPRSQDVVVPPWLKHQAHLVLQIGTDMPIPCPDLVVNDAGISATLSFARTPYKCIVPWKYVWAIIGDERGGAVFEENIPPEIQAEMKGKKATKRQQFPAIKPVKVAVKPTTAARMKARGLRVIKGGNGGGHGAVR